MSNIIPMEFDKKQFPFTNECWFNATVAAKHHGKLAKDWLKADATKAYIAEVAKELDIQEFIKEDFSRGLKRTTRFSLDKKRIYI